MSHPTFLMPHLGRTRSHLGQRTCMIHHFSPPLWIGSGILSSDHYLNGCSPCPWLRAARNYDQICSAAITSSLLCEDILFFQILSIARTLSEWRTTNQTTPFTQTNPWSWSTSHQGIVLHLNRLSTTALCANFVAK
jgi:hypothetical protein